MGYDIIIGIDLLIELGIDLINSTQVIKWDDAEIPMRAIDSTIHDSYLINDPPAIQAETARITSILDAKYEKADIEQIAKQCKLLNKEQKRKFYNLLNKHKTLFDGTLGKWKHTQHQIKLVEGAEPYHGKSYKIPQTYEATLKLEVERLIKLGVLTKGQPFPMVGPLFYHTKEGWYCQVHIRLQRGQ